MKSREARSTASVRVALLLLVPVLLSGCVYPAFFSGATLAPALAGTVTDEAGAPVAGASVERTISGDRKIYPRETQTDSNGDFAFERLYVRHRYYVIGVALNYPVPDTHRIEGDDQLDVTCEGFLPGRAIAGEASRAAGSGLGRVVEIRLREQ